MRIRIAKPSDAKDILAVYAPYCKTPVTFETQVPSLEAYTEYLRNIQATYPCLVAEDDAEGIVGFAYAHAQAERAAYQWNAELSVYCASGACGRGLGSTFYDVLLGFLQLMGVHTAYARVTVPNAASEHLHEMHGFTCVWIQADAGWKCGAWHDVAWFVKSLIAPQEGEVPAPPSPFAQVAEAHAEEVAHLLSTANAAIEADRN